MSDETISARFHNARVNDLLEANNRYLQRARDAEAELLRFKTEGYFEADAADFAERIIEALLPDADQARKRHEVNILSDAIQVFIKELMQ